MGRFYMAYTFIELIKDSIKIAGRPLSVSEIWNIAKENGLETRLRSCGRTPEKTIDARIYVDLKKNGEKSCFVKFHERPVKFYLRELPPFDDSVSENNSESTNRPTYKEKDLHKILSSFVYSNSQFGCYTKTIPHQRSRHHRRGVNEWIHPDIIGVRYPFDDYCSDVRLLMRALEINTCKIYSFELKTKVDFSTLRESYFQAVSNSSWANEGYLVAAEYDPSPEFWDEMLRLNNAFGIGFIKLNLGDYTQSEVLLSARQNESMDWTTIDRLSQDNEVFKNFIKSVRKELERATLERDSTYQVTEEYDTVFESDEEFQNYLTERNM